MPDEQTEMIEEQEPSQVVAEVPTDSFEADEGDVVPVTSSAQAPLMRMRPAFTRRSSSFKPAYLILAVAVMVVGVLSVLLFQEGAGLLAQVPSLFSQSDGQKTPIVQAPQGTVDVRPAFPTPGGGQGGQQSSLPPSYVQPTMAGVPTASATEVATPISTSTVQGGSFTLQFTAVPTQVNNYTTVQVGVISSEPGVSVRLQVSYDVSPYSYSSGGTADDAGQAMLSWRVHVASNRIVVHAIAQITVTAQDQNGQQASTQTIIVQVNVFGGG